MLSETETVAVGRNANAMGTRRDTVRPRVWDDEGMSIIEKRYERLGRAPSSSSLLVSKIQKENGDRPRRRAASGEGEMVVNGEDGLSAGPVQPETKPAVPVSAHLIDHKERENFRRLVTNDLIDEIYEM